MREFVSLAGVTWDATRTIESLVTRSQNTDVCPTDIQTYPFELLQMEDEQDPSLVQGLVD